MPTVRPAARAQAVRAAIVAAVKAAVPSVVRIYGDEAPMLPEARADLPRAIVRLADASYTDGGLNVDEHTWEWEIVLQDARPATGVVEATRRAVELAVEEQLMAAAVPFAGVCVYHECGVASAADDLLLPGLEEPIWQLVMPFRTVAYVATAGAAA